jgi:hypothetical protein
MRQPVPGFPQITAGGVPRAQGKQPLTRRGGEVTGKDMIV